MDKFLIERWNNMDICEESNNKTVNNDLSKSTDKVHRSLLIDAEKISIITHIPLSEVKKDIEGKNLYSLLDKINSKELSPIKQQKLDMLFELAQELNHE